MVPIILVPLKPRMKALVFALIFSLGLSHVLQSQDVRRWSLQECIEYALKNNPQLLQNGLAVQQSQLNLLQSKAQVLPTLQGSANHTYNTGRRIDPFTNQFANQRVLSQNFSLSSGLTLFSGLTNFHSIQANQAALKSSQFGNDQFKNDVALQVTNAFLNVLLADELLRIAESQAELAKTQRERAQMLLDAGRSARGDYLQVEAAEANEQLNLVNARNRKGLALLTLAQLLNLEDPEGFDISAPDFSKLKTEMPPYKARDLYVTALGNQPGIQSAAYSLRSAEYSLKATRGAYLPTLSAFGGIGTGYSQLARTQVGSVTQQQNVGSIGGQPIIIDVEVPVYELTPFNQQWDQNFNRTFGFSLNVPLFNNLRTRTQVGQAKINVENARLNEQLRKNQLRRDIQSAWFDAQAAYTRFKAAEKSLASVSEAFGYMQQRYDAGVSSIFDFQASRNQLVNAQATLAQARFELILRIKVLDFYQGNPISF